MFVLHPLRAFSEELGLRALYCVCRSASSQQTLPHTHTECDDMWDCWCFSRILMIELTLILVSKGLCAVTVYSPAQSLFNPTQPKLCRTSFMQLNGGKSLQPGPEMLCIAFPDEGRLRCFIESQIKNHSWLCGIQR